MGTLLQISEVTTKTQVFINELGRLAAEYVPKIVGAILLYIAGSWLIRRFSGFLQKSMGKKKYDVSLQSFLFSFLKISLTVLLLLSIFSLLGVDVTAFSALLVGAGLAIGTALNGTLGNFAGGVMLLIFKHFKVGDFIEGQGQTGTVLELGIFNTVILTLDHRTVILANGPLSTGIIINYTSHGSLRVDTVMAIDGAEDIDKARKLALDAILALPKVLKTPAPEIAVQETGHGMTTFVVRPYAMQPDYWDVYYEVQEVVKKTWDAAGIKEALPTSKKVNVNK
jgi:small conductance mechanosensitive channel